MKLILITTLSFILFNISSMSGFAQCNTTAIDLNTWTANGGTWTVGTGGSYVDQTVNGAGVFFLSPQPFINVLISGTLRTDDSDDDIMGFVFGVEGTIGSGNFHYYRFEWDQGGDGNGMYVREVDQTGVVSTLLAIPGSHWTRGYDHNFTLLYQTSRIKITMDGSTKLDIQGCFNPGKFGFYNHSQAYVRYSNFQYTPMTDFTFTTPPSICVYNQLQTNIFCLNSANNPYAVIRWDFGDGTIVNNVTSAQHNYSSAGTYNVELYVEDFFGCKDSVSKQVIVYDPSFSLGQDQSICPSTTTSFSPDNTNNGDTYVWSSGQSTSSITTGTPGNYILTITDINGCVAKDTVNLSIMNLPNVNFSASPECLYDSLSFVNNTQNTSALFWDFGDGTISTLTSPKHKYTTQGTHSIKLVTTFAQGCKDSTTQDVMVYDVPTAEFTFTNDCYNKNAYFTDASTIGNGSITTWNWDYGDGTTQTAQQGSHLYSSEGNYDVRLIVESNNGCTDTTSHSVTRYPLPVANFSASTECIYTPVQFTDQSTINSPDNILQWNWDFGSGQTGITQNPSALLPQVGVNTVKLTVISNHGCADSTVATVETYAQPNASFVTSDGCNNMPATFINNSTVSDGVLIGWNWDFGDGTTMSSQNASHQYPNAGVYNVQLIVESNHNCTDTSVVQVERFPIPLANFIYTEECEYTPLNFTNQSSVDNGFSITNYSWNFGDGSPNDNNENTTHLYGSEGLYQVTLSVTSNNNCMDDTTINVNVYPAPIVNFNTDDKCINEGNNNFFNTSYLPSGNFNVWEWDFGDGQSSSMLAPAHHYSTPGDYNVSLVGISDHMCSDTITKSVSIYNKPTALFTEENVEGCIPVCSNFNDSSTDDYGIQFWEWSFENHEGSAIATPALCFEEDGEFDVQLIVTNLYNCKDTLLKSDLVKAYPNPIADFSISSPITDVLHPLVRFENNSFDATKWKWNLGNGKIDTVNYYTDDFYENAGTYAISLNVENDYGCTDSLTKELVVLSKAFFYIPNSFTPNGDGINDVFMVKAESFNFTSLTIFDRWGKQVFYTEHIDKPWDGTNKGQLVETGTYVWVLKYKDLEGNDQVEKGDVTVLK